jgi:hypothetical protein
MRSIAVSSESEPISRQREQSVGQKLLLLTRGHLQHRLQRIVYSLPEFTVHQKVDRLHRLVVLDDGRPEQRDSAYVPGKKLA